MPNTQSSQNVFQRQSYSANGQRPLGGVWQDKTAPKRDRAAMIQPASPKNMTRTQQMDTNTSRSQKHSNQRQTVQINLWVKPSLKAELQRLAATEGLSVSKIGGVFLEEAIRQKLHIQHAVLLQPIIEQAIRKQMRGISTRLAWLLVRVAFDSGQTRSIVTNILSRQLGVTQPVLEQILSGSSKTAKGNIMRRTPQIVELIEAVEQWIVAEEGEKQTHE